MNNQPVIPKIEIETDSIPKGNHIKKFSDDEEEKDDNELNEDEKKPQGKVLPLQSILLSATLTSAVDKLAGLALKNPLFIDNALTENSPDCTETTEEGSSSLTLPKDLVVPSTVTLNYMIVPIKMRLVALSALIAKNCNNKSCKILVFVSTQNIVDYYHDILTEILTKKTLDDDDEKSSDDEEDDEEKSEKSEEDSMVEALVNVRFFK